MSKEDMIELEGVVVADAGADEDLISLSDDGRTGRADILRHRKDKLSLRKIGLDPFVYGQIFVLRRMDAAPEGWKPHKIVPPLYAVKKFQQSHSQRITQQKSKAIFYHLWRKTKVFFVRKG